MVVFSIFLNIRFIPMENKLFDISIFGGIVNYAFPDDEFLNIFTQTYDDVRFEGEEIGSKRTADSNSDRISTINDRMKQGCSICLDTESLKESCHIVRCSGNHVVCKGCALLWFNRNRICPAGCGFSLTERYDCCIQSHRIYDLTVIRNFFVELRNSNFDFDVPNSEGRPALILAIINRRVDIINLLLEFGADPDIEDNEGNSALFYACQKDLDEEPDTDDTEDTEHPDLMPILLKGGADINSSDCNDNPVIHHIIECDAETSLLSYFIDMREPLSQVCPDGFTLIGKAFQYEREYILLDLCSTQTNKNIGNVVTRDSPIQVGIQYSTCDSVFKEMFDIYFQYGVSLYNVHQNRAGFTDLHFCVQFNKPNLLNFFLRYVTRDRNIEEDFPEFFVDIQDKKGQTALFLACSLGHSQCIRLLLRADANTTIKNEDGISPKQIALEKNFHEVIEIFDEFGIIEPIVLEKRFYK